MSRPLRLMLLASVALVVSMAFAGPAMAQAPKFHSVDSAVNNTVPSSSAGTSAAWATKTSTTR